jgi:hypothetical protein
MTEWTPSVEQYRALDDAAAMLRPTPRRVRRTALRSAPSRRALHADARAVARHVHGRDAFIWQGRVLPIGMPLAAMTSVLTWRRRRSVLDALAAALGVGVASYIEARVEWSVYRRAYRRRGETL